ncbi:MAG: Flp pilus assembly complex ATPase component [Desulfobacteraceae bacterium]|nr:Flp pilus assembly complex ATPase component [Desulfobacteraceae bacterium]
MENDITDQIISCLIKDNLITDKQVQHAQKIKSKIVSSKRLIDILKDLKYVSEEQIKTALTHNKHTFKIGDLLVEFGYLTHEKLEAALKLQKTNKDQRLGDILIEQKFLAEDDFLDLLSIQLGFPHVEPDVQEIDKELISKASIKWYRHHNILPMYLQEGKPLIAFSDPFSKDSSIAAKKIFGSDFVTAVASQNVISSLLNKLEHGSKTNIIKEDSVQAIVDSIIQSAILEETSDIHFEPFKNKLTVRFRQDGILIHYKDYPLEIIPMLTSRLKIMSGANIAEKRLHQGGRISFDFNGTEYDLRASFYVSVFGEKIVLRILNNVSEIININKIGMQPKLMDRFLQDVLDTPSGVILVTGPTGSGKTTTVYSCINHIKKPEISIITAEEPVEYIMNDVIQCSINPNINLTYEETLRHVVRQDPDVIVIGEIRDSYSADVAVHAALTGHKVLTSFHTEDSIGGLIRLMNMDIEAFLVSSTVVCVLAQRLLRKVCDKCARPYNLTPTDLYRLEYKPPDVSAYQFVKGKGCSHCRYTGYKGRIAVFEMLILNEFVRDAILTQKSSYEIRKVSIETSGLLTLLEDAIHKASLGITTIEEIFRCVPKLLKPRSISEIKRLQGN